MGKSTINGQFSTALLVYRRVTTGACNEKHSISATSLGSIRTIGCATGILFCGREAGCSGKNMLRSLILMEVETWTVFLPEKDLSSRIARMSGLGEPERLNQGVVRDPKAPETTSSFLNGKVWQSKTDDGTERCSVLCIYMIYIYIYMMCIYIYIYMEYMIYIYIWTDFIYGSFTKILVYRGEMLILLRL